MLKLKCTVQNYAWGKISSQSEVARLYARNQHTEIEQRPYAELWMGTHPSGPSTVSNSTLSLEDWIQEHPDCLGKVVLEKFGTKLPFLFKVLSIEKALSIQSHPDKTLAQQLHAEHPEVYKDSNHKPEMAIALSSFEALCGFSSFEEILISLESYPEMESCIGKDLIQSMHQATSSNHKEALQGFFTKLMTTSKEVYGELVTKMVKRVREQDPKNRSARDELVLKLEEQYPQDIGIFASCLLNYVCLNEGEALYLPANEPHAYISGEIVECMASSDNVIRAGLTPKFRDTSTLCQSLTYTMGSPCLLQGEQHGESEVRYNPPFEEFEVHRIQVVPTQIHHLLQNKGPSLLLVYKGEAVMKLTSHEKECKELEDVVCVEGNVLFVANYISAKIQGTDPTQPCILWQARVNQSLF